MFGKKTSSSPAPTPVQPAAESPALKDSPAPVASPAAAKPILPAGLPETRTSEAISLATYTDPKLETADYNKAKGIVTEDLLERVDFQALENLPRAAKRDRIRELADGFIATLTIPLNSAQHALLKSHVVDEVLGLGPLEPLLADNEVSDIMINTHRKVYIEKNGKIYLSDVTFTSERHLLNVVQKIVSSVGRRIDENSPMVDARMADGSRFNAIIPPLALDGTLVSIRKFKKNKIPLANMVDYDSMSREMARFLEICASIRLNIIVSGGTGSGKTTLLNAMSGHIDGGERVITIEDAAELQLHQPHVLRLETRPANSEGSGEINQRQLIKNALRMRPDRIILGEIRGDEVVDLLTAMNTGHDGSMATIHSNSPRDCLTRLENLIGMSGLTLPLHSLRHQISSALQLVVQVARMRDGKRRVVQIEEIVGMEGEIVSTQTLFSYKATGLNDQGSLAGEFSSSGIRPRFLSQATYFGRDKELLECLRIGGI